MREYVTKDAPSKGKTGYDELLENKEAQIAKLEHYVARHEVVAVKDVAEHLGCSERTASRYLADVRKRYKFRMFGGDEVALKKKRIRRFKELIAKHHGTWGLRDYAKALGISRMTLRIYRGYLTKGELKLYNSYVNEYNRQQADGKAGRIEQLRQLLKKDPFMSNREMREKMHISKVTLLSYLSVIRGWEVETVKKTGKKKRG